MKWLNDKTVYAHIARLYDLKNKPDPFEEFQIEGSSVILLRRANVDHILVQSPNNSTSQWISDFVRNNSKRNVQTFCGDSDLLFFKDVTSLQANCTRYDIFHLMGDIELPLCQPNYEFRSLTENDKDQLISLFQEDKEPHDDFTEELGYALFLNNLSLGAFHESRLVGVVGLYNSTSTDLEVGRGFTSPSFRRRNIHGFLMQQLITNIRTSGDDRQIFSWVEVGNVKPRRILTDAGFQLFGNICALELSL